MKNFTTAALLVVSLLPSATARLHQDQQKSPDVCWVSSGGGWRAMVASMGYANVLHNVDLFPNLESVSTNSGASWFAVQAFYSEQFYQAAVAATEPQDLAYFVRDWMQQYLSLQENIAQQVDIPLCADSQQVAQLFPIPNAEPSDLQDLCNLLFSFGGSWADFIQSMFQVTAASYGDASLSDREMNRGNRIDGMSEVSLFLQTAVAPVSRVLNDEDEDDIAVYLTPKKKRRNLKARGGRRGNNKPSKLYTVPVAAQFAVTGDKKNADFNLAAPKSLQTVYGTAPETFSFADYESFHLFPGVNGSVRTEMDLATSKMPKKLKRPFDGKPTVTQAASASSAATAVLSGSVPSVLAQKASMLRFGIANHPQMTEEMKAGALAQLEAGTNVLYQFSLLHELAICSVWPGPCDESDVRLIDGGLSDGMSLALTIAQYQDSKKTKKNMPTLKVIATNNDYYTNTAVNFVSYFQTPYNQGVTPGEFIWMPAIGQGDLGHDAPWQSIQIFADALDQATLSTMLSPLMNNDGSTATSLRYALLNGTTTDNLAFSVKAGQRVEILYIELNSDIPTIVIGRNITKQSLDPLADLAQTIAENTELKELVQEFVA